MSKKNSKAQQLSPAQAQQLLAILKTRFQKNRNRPKNIIWEEVAAKLNNSSQKLWTLQQMEATGGEPDLVDFDKKTGEYIFIDCAAETPAGRRSLCYDEAALQERKENKPAGSAMQMATDMGAELLSETQYRQLQQLGKFDTKTSSWIFTPENIRKLGGAIFCDRRYDTVFMYHNGAQSYYAARGFRVMVKV
ncbi:MAG: hypothetical protein RL172_22 [Bacteroidota bacterium]|jgi:hypothetical protein